MTSQFPRNWADWESDTEDSLDHLYKEITETYAVKREEPHRFEKSEITSDELIRWASWTRPFPLPDYLAPTGGKLFDTLTDDDLLNAPPHMIVHLQRTAAQCGLQVVSPRQTPFSYVMNRTVDERRDLGDHVVGSTASKNDEWPTIDGADFSQLLPDEPLPMPNADPYVRERTRSEPLTRASHLMRDPILACLIKGRAVIDIQQRDDVMGDAETLTEILADAWSVDKHDLMELDAFSLGVDGPLLRHAIKADDVYPVVHAPVHMLKSISVSSSDVSRRALPDDSAMDWRRMRVFCEAVYLLATKIEGIPLRLARAIPPPGDPGAPLNRPNVLAFRPAPCTAWSFESRSFSIAPIKGDKFRKIKQIPAEVLKALTRYTEAVRPVSHALTAGYTARARMTKLTDVEMANGETLTDGYRTLLCSLTVGSARGKGVARTLRNYIYEAVDSAPMEIRLKLARYINIANEECRIHLNERVVPDIIISRLADRFLAIGAAIREKIAAEAARRYVTVDDWWRDITSLVPASYSRMSEGTMGWAKIAMWLIFRKPSDKWDSLVRLMHYKAIRDSEIATVGSIALPPEHGSEARILHAARAYVKGMTKAYHGYYTAVSDVGQILADIVKDRGYDRKAETLREASYLWCLRARALRGTNVSPIAHDKPTPSMNHLRTNGPGFDLLVVPSPYRAFEAYRTHVKTSTIVHKTVKAQIMAFDDEKISSLFVKLREPFAPAPKSTVTRYLIEPHRMAEDWESAWKMLAEDVSKVIRIYGLEAEKMTDDRPKPPEILELEPEEVSIDMTPRAPGKGFYDYMGELECDEADWVDDTLDSLPNEMAEVIRSREYSDVDQLRKTLLGASAAHKQMEKASKETVA